LVVIGVHTPEFSFEHDIDRVGRATRERAIDYPVAVDNDYEVWSAFDNRYWPALYFIDAEGIIRDHHFGEGRYEKSERTIQRLLRVEREPVSVEGVGSWLWGTGLVEQVEHGFRPSRGRDPQGELALTGEELEVEEGAALGLAADHATEGLLHLGVGVVGEHDRVPLAIACAQRPPSQLAKLIASFGLLIRR
jgi:hypothetical protein